MKLKKYLFLFFILVHLNEEFVCENIRESTIFYVHAIFSIQIKFHFWGIYLYTTCLFKGI